MLQIKITINTTILITKPDELATAYFNRAKRIAWKNAPEPRKNTMRKSIRDRLTGKNKSLPDRPGARMRIKLPDANEPPSETASKGNIENPISRDITSRPCLSDELIKPLKVGTKTCCARLSSSPESMRGSVNAHR